MIKRIKLRFRDMKTISELISGADEQANLNGKEEVGAEHFVLSALHLKDGSAKRIFERIGASADTFKDAIRQQYTDSLASIGIDGAEGISTEPVQSSSVFVNSHPSGQELMTRLYEMKKNDKHRPLLGAHVISVASLMEHGVVARAFRTLEIDADALAVFIKEEIEAQTV